MFPLEIAFEKSYESAIQDNIFKPLKMTHSGYDYAKLKSPYKTVGYNYISETRHTTALVWDTSWEYSSGGLYSSLPDLAKFDQALKTNQLIRTESLAKTYTPTQWNYSTLFKQSLVLFLQKAEMSKYHKHQQSSL